jgi:hypothetical protein
MRSKCGRACAGRPTVTVKSSHAGGEARARSYQAREVASAAGYYSWRGVGLSETRRPTFSLAFMVIHVCVTHVVYAHELLAGNNIVRCSEASHLACAAPQRPCYCEAAPPAAVCAGAAAFA